MRSRRALVLVSVGQLLAGVLGHAVAVLDGRPFDIALIGWRGRADRVGHDAWLLGTGLSAPVAMMAAQVVITTRLARAPSRGATRALGVLGAAMTGGYLVERQFRDALRPGRWDRRVTPVVACGCVLSVSMAVLGFSRDLQGREQQPSR